MMIKRIVSLFACLVIAVTMAFPAYADTETDVFDGTDYEDYYSEYLDEYDTLYDSYEDTYEDFDAQLDRVVDNADLLSTREEDALRDKIDEIIDEYQFDCVILTVDSYSRDNMLGAVSYVDISWYADNFYNKNGYGFGVQNDGIIFVVSMREREWWFLQFGDGKDIISDSYGLEWLEYKVIDELSDGEYYECFDKFVSSVHDFVREATDDSPYSTGHPNLDVEAYWEKINDKLIIIIVITAVALIIIAALLKKTMKTVKRQPDANSYVKKGSFKLYFMNDTFMYTNTTRTRVSSSSRGGGRRGGSRGGRGGRF